MDSGLYAACAGLIAKTDSLDTIASNLANASSAGFRGQRNVFGSVLAQAAHHGRLSPLNQAANSYGVLSGRDLDQTQGTLTPTGNDLDVALQGPGFFKVQTAKGSAYTRNGSFQVSSTGQLITASGDAVLGEAGPVLVSGTPIVIGADGTVSSGGAVTAKLKVVTFDPAAALTSQGNGYYAAAASDEKPVPEASIRQGSVENSNVSPVEGMVQLISAQRSAETMRRVLSMLDTEMDKTAAQDLPHVNAS